MTAAFEELTTTSADGTRIGFRKLGSGPALVFVHGSISMGDQWLPVAEQLSANFTCYLMDRRGRGLSGNAERYSLSIEADDIKAVLAAAGGNAFLLGHSYGAIAALQAMVEDGVVPALVLYEPPLPVNGPVAGGALDPFSRQVERGKLDDALQLAMTDILDTPAEAVAAIRQTPLWAPMAALTPTWPREMREIDALEPGVGRYSFISVPTLLLLGGETAEHHVVATTALNDALPDARIVKIPGQAHFAHLGATTGVAETILSFLQKVQQG